MRQLDHKEGWGSKNWCFKLWYCRRLLRVPWIARRSNQSILKEINSEYSLEGLMQKFQDWPLDAKSQLTGKDPDAGKYWGQKEKGAAEDEMVGWHHQLNRHEFQWTLGDSGRQRSLSCCSPCDWKETRLSDWTTRNKVQEGRFKVNQPCVKGEQACWGEGRNPQWKPDNWWDAQDTGGGDVAGDLASRQRARSRVHTAGTLFARSQ